MPKITHIFFDAGGTILEVEYRHLRSVLAAAPPSEHAPPEGHARHDGHLQPAGLSSTAGQGPPDARLSNSRHLPTDAEFAAVEREARAWSLAQIEAGSTGDLWRGYFERIFAGAGVAPDRIPGALERLWQVNVRAGLWQRAAPDAAATLEALRSLGYRLAVISNSEGRVAKDIAIAGLADYFEIILDSHNVGVAKPDPRIFEIALEKTAARAPESIYVGDVFGIDVRGARAAGLEAILIDRLRLQLDVPCRRIEGLGELVGLFDRPAALP